jgi:hypothetical protein
MTEEEIFKFAVYLFCVCVYSIIGLIGYYLLLKVAKYGDMVLTFLSERYNAEQRSRTLKLRLLAKRERREMSAR